MTLGNNATQQRRALLHPAADDEKCCPDAVIVQNHQDIWRMNWVGPIIKRQTHCGRRRGTTHEKEPPRQYHLHHTPEALADSPRCRRFRSNRACERFELTLRDKLSRL